MDRKPVLGINTSGIRFDVTWKTRNIKCGSYTGPVMSTRLGPELS
jgi:hypothetical protein